MRKPGWQPIDGKLWHWKHVVAAPWKHKGESINALEARAYLLALMWRSRACCNFNTRFLQLVDSQTTLGAATKHRSKSTSFKYVVPRCSAIILAFKFQPMLAYVRSKRNPADKPSRLRLRIWKPAKSLRCQRRAASS